MAKFDAESRSQGWGGDRERRGKNGIDNLRETYACGFCVAFSVFSYYMYSIVVSLFVVVKNGYSNFYL